MRYLIVGLLPALLLLSSCEVEEKPIVRVPARITSFRLGYIEDTKETSSRVEADDDKFGVFKDESFIAFTDKTTLDKVEKERDKGDVGKFGGLSFDIEPSRYQFTEDGELVVRTIPENAMISKVEVTLDNDSVLVVTGTKDDKIRIKCIGLGKVTLNLTVKGAYNTVKESFPIRVVDKCQVDFYITSPFWTNGTIDKKSIFQCRLRFRMKRLPANMDHLPLVYRDSIHIITSCPYLDYDPKKDKLYNRVAVDTVKLETEEHFCLTMPKRKNFIRNITNALTYGNGMKHQGYSIERFTNDKTGEVYERIIPYDYPYTVDQVILLFKIYGTDPNIEYEFNSKCKWVNYVLEEDGSIQVDAGSDEDEDDDDEQYVEVTDKDEEGNESKRQSLVTKIEGHFDESKKQYFAVQFCNFGETDEDNEKNAQKFKDDLKKSGYEDNMTEEAKDEKMKEMEKHKKEGDDL